MIEEARRFSDSSFWQRSRDFYEEKGLSSWRSGEVPFRVTTSPTLAHSYAQLLAAYLDEAGADPSEPVYVLEIGAGSGAFAQAFMREWYHGDEARHAQPIHYLVSDGAHSNVSSYETTLKSERDAGRLSFLHFDVSAPALTVSRKNPLVVFANYIFDSLPNDAFLWNGETLQEWLCALTPEPVFSTAPAKPYGDAMLDGIVHAHFEEGEISFPFPITALRFLDWMKERTDGRFCILSTDKGSCDLTQFTESEPPHVAQHGSESVMTNYFALAEWVRRHSGTAVMSPRRYFPFHFAALTIGGGARRLRWAFSDAFGAMTPADVSTLVSAPDTIDTWLAHMRLARYDTAVFALHSPKLTAQLNDTLPTWKRLEARDVLLAINQRRHLAINFPVAFQVGVHLTQLRFFSEAVVALLQAAEETPPFAGHAWLLASVAMLEMGEHERARQGYQRALSLQGQAGNIESFAGTKLAFLAECKRLGLDPN